MAKTAVALIVAAGESRRMGGDVPKQYQMLGGKSLLCRSIEAFLQHPLVSGVKVVINAAHQAHYDAQSASLNLLPCAHGGATRQESVRQGLLSLADEAPDYVLIHDAARPNLGLDLISQVLAGLECAPAVIPALPVIDTLKHIEEERVVGTIERKKLFRAQTPQGFHFKSIMDAHQQCGDCNYTDDAMVAENAGLEVRIVTGSEHNYKITTNEDMRDAQLLLASLYETRVGMGLDAHRLVPHQADSIASKRVVRLCGIAVPFESELEGHSDGDVALHAIVDALLGAMGEGDIGSHFSPNDPRWRGMNSERFLLHAYQILTQKRGRIAHLDVTLICERPRIGPHRLAMVENIARLLDVEPARVSVKATTTDRMGFTGRGEGIAAQAVATLRLPVSGQ
jgi:2-C-methyl-D-erythritol 4-phosphate cytidylyltransferase / 2-C-methyl-D-erythritol 2,4-cyclodiphosphate synthase